MADSRLRTYLNNVTAEKKFIRNNIPHLGEFNSMLEHFNSELRAIIEGHHLIPARKRASLLKTVQENGQAIDRGNRQLVDTARFNIMGFRPTAVDHYASISSNFKTIDEALTAVELKSSLSTEKRLVALMWRLKRIGDWQIPRYFIHKNPKLRAIYRTLYFADRPLPAPALRARPLDESEKDLKCVICHDHATSDPFLPVMKMYEGHDPATSTAPTVPRSANDESSGKNPDKQETGLDNAKKSEDGTEVAGKSTDILPDNGTLPGGSSDIVPGYGLTPCCKKGYHPFCLIPQNDRSEICPMCGADWEDNLGFQIEMHELRVRQIQQQLAEWDAEDLQES